MCKLIINGGVKLKGELDVDGAKNAVLPILAATILNGGQNKIGNAPKLKDVAVMLNILEAVGCKASFSGNTITVDSSTMNNTSIPEDLVGEMRSSIFLMGAVISRFGRVGISYPGGCEIGHRPIDLHLKGLRSMGVKINEAHGYIYAEADNLIGADIHLNYPSVGATENIMQAAVFAKGTTYIRNAAREPEIVDLQNFLNSAGARITGAGSSVIKIEGANKLHGVEHEVMPDRIVAGTYMVAAGITGGDIILRKVMPEHINSIISTLRECGCRITIKKNLLQISGPPRPKAVDVIRTLPYPGFPTDMQAQMVALLSIAKGTGVVTETVFESRFKHVDELLRMGANIKIEGRMALIKGVRQLTGASVTARDLRGGAALVLAGLAAEGETTVNNIQHIDRGYESIEEKLAIVGARIKRIP